MHAPGSLLLGLAVATHATAATAASDTPDHRALALRALANSPSQGYAPQIVDCPAERPEARAASSLSPNETAWLALRHNQTQQPLVAFLQAANIAGFDAAAYLASVSSANTPRIGLAMSGGGYRALMNGAGFLAAADSRVEGQPSVGSIAGLLQASTYLAGLSGGSWLVGSMFANNYSTTVQLRDGRAGSNLWRFDNTIFAGPSDDAQDGSANTTSASASAKARRGLLDTASYWTAVADQVADKADAGFETSLTDYWGRALSYQLIDAEAGGPAYTFSSVALADDFAQGATPFPIIVADSRAPGTTTIALNSTVYEFNAFEMGSWDPTTYGFVPTAYLGSNFSDGRVANASDSHCVRGLDQFGYVMGTSSTLFNQFLLNNISAAVNVPSFVVNVITDVLTKLGNDNNDIAQWVPNPFYQYNPDTNPFADQTQLTLVDGGEDLQNLPLHPLIQPLRALDLVVAVDASADTDFSWPNGTALRATFDRQFGDIANGTLFPAVPDANTFVNLGLNQRPTFFGCDAANFSVGPGQRVPPLVVYLPNAPLTAFSNVSTFDPEYTLAERNAIIENGFNAATRGNGTLDANWPACLACATLSRSFQRTNATVPDVCTQCFADYCWDGTLNTTNVAVYEPELLLAGASTLADSAASPSASLSSTTVVSLVAVVSFLLLV